MHFFYNNQNSYLLASNTAACYNPVYPLQKGTEYHIVKQSNKNIVNLSRLLPTTKLTISFKNLNPDGLLYYETGITYDYFYTIVTDKNELLFDCLLVNKKIKWKKDRARTYDLELQFVSSSSWTPPIYDAYFFNTFNSWVKPGVSYFIDGVNYTTPTHSTDANVLSTTGKALKYTITEAGSYASRYSINHWKNFTNEYSFSILLQSLYLNAANVVDHPIDLVKVTDTEGNFISIVIIPYAGSPAGQPMLQVQIYNNTENSTLDSDTIFINFEGAWFDICYTYFALENKHYLYLAKADGTSIPQTLFSSVVANHVYDNSSNIEGCPYRNWSDLYLFHERGEQTSEVGDAGYFQNLLFLNSFTSLAQFETYRKLMYMWNQNANGVLP
jgi:hypothetical protein